MSSTQYLVTGLPTDYFGNKIFQIGRRTLAYLTDTDVYRMGTITAISETTDTTVTVSWDSASLIDEPLIVYVGIDSPYPKHSQSLNRRLFTRFADGEHEYEFVGCVIRNTGAGWDFIDDANHKPIGYASVDDSSIANAIVLTHSETRIKNVSCFCVMDETFAQMGLIPGVSSNLIDTRIYMGMPASVVFSSTLAPNS